MLTPNTKDFWALKSGLLPVHLSPSSNEEKYILLDGGRFDFCLDFSGEDIDIMDIYSNAWSADVKNYITIRNDKAQIYNWALMKSETVKLDNITHKFDEFFRILNSITFKSSEDVAPFLIGLFSKIRNLTMEVREPIKALNLLYKLLLSIDYKECNQEICDFWGIENEKEPIGFDSLKKSIRSGIREIKPNLDYILRHGSGPLFEAAHREALYFNPSLNLFGEISDKVIYSSSSSHSGVHYTPRFLVRCIVENALKITDISAPSLTILDPACGSGSFLQEALKQLRELNYSGDVTVKGFDVSSTAISTALFLLNYENREQWNNRLKIEITCKDSLSIDWGKNDIILMNPPYIAHDLLDSKTKEKIEDIVKNLGTKNRVNLASIFLYKAVTSLTNKGALGAVLPSTLLSQEIYRSLREFLFQSASLNIVAQLGNFVFKDALIDTCFILVSTGLKDNNTQKPLNIWCRNNEESAFQAISGLRKMQFDNSPSRITEDYNIFRPTRFPGISNSWKVISKEEDSIIEEIRIKIENGALLPLSRIFDIKQGIITGKNEAFEFNLKEFNQLSHKEQKLLRPLLSSKTFDYGRVIKSQYLWYPYSELGNLIKSEEELRKYGYIYNKLCDFKNQLINRENINWWDLTRPRIDLFNGSGLLLCSKRYGSSNSFILTSSSYVLIDGNVFQFKNDKYIEEDKYFYFAIFNSNMFKQLLAMYAKPLMAGYDLGKAQIKNIPIIDVNIPGIRRSEVYTDLVNLGMQLSEGKMIDIIALNNIVRLFY